MAAGAIPVAANTTDVAVTARNVTLMGWSIKDTAAAVATVSLHNGTSASDPAIAYINLAASESKSEWYGPQGIACPNGIWLERLTGTTALVVHTA